MTHTYPLIGYPNLTGVKINIRGHNFIPDHEQELLTEIKPRLDNGEGIPTMFAAGKQVPNHWLQACVTGLWDLIGADGVFVCEDREDFKLMLDPEARSFSWALYLYDIDPYVGPRGDLMPSTIPYIERLMLVAERLKSFNASRRNNAPYMGYFNNGRAALNVMKCVMIRDEDSLLRYQGQCIEQGAPSVTLRNPKGLYGEVNKK